MCKKLFFINLILFQFKEFNEIDVGDNSKQTYRSKLYSNIHWNSESLFLFWLINMILNISYGRVFFGGKKWNEPKIDWNLQAHLKKSLNYFFLQCNTSPDGSLCSLWHWFKRHINCHSLSCIKHLQASLQNGFNSN